MIAKRTGLIRGLAGTRRVRKGVTTADDGADIVRTHPHLWEPLRVDYPAAFMAWPDPPAATVGAGSEHSRIVDGLPHEGEPDTAATPTDADLVDAAATPPSTKPPKATRAKATPDDADAA